METGDLIAALAGAIALVALGLSIFAAWRSERLATSDYEAKQRVKLETAELLATLRSFMNKGVVYTQRKPGARDNPTSEAFVSIEHEREALNRFVLSATAVAFQSFVADRSRLATERAVQSEPWRAFFLQLGELLHTPNPWSAAQQAAGIERLLTSLTEADLRSITEYLNDLSKAVHALLAAQEHDVIVNVLVNRAGAQEEITDDDFLLFVRFLREVKRVDDPDVDLFWSTSSGVVDDARDALDRGADLNVHSGEIIQRYSALVEEFRKKQNAV